MQIFFSMFLLKRGIKSTRFWNNSLNLELSVLNLIFYSKIRFFSFQIFANGHNYYVFSALINVVKLVVEKNTVSTLPNVVNIYVEIGNIDCRLFNVAHSTLTNTTLFQRWFDVVRSREVISTQQKCWNSLEMFAG